MGTPTVPFQQSDLGDAYETLYNVLKKMYWEASTVDAKDEIHGVMEEVSEIIDQLDSEELEKGTATFLALQSKINEANKALQKVQNDVTKITKNIGTAANAVSAIEKVLSLLPKA